MKKFNKRMGRSRSGVSDIIGNLLILAITVTLFSSIMFYVANMPEPAQATFTDLEPSLSNVLDDDSIWVNVTHKGGQVLKGWSTGIYLFVNDSLIPELKVSDGGVGEDWRTGEVWRYNIQNLTDLSSLSIMVVDKDTNSIVWQANLLGGVSGIELAPIIGERYTSPSPGIANETLTVFVRVFDPNGDEVTDVHLDLTTLGLTSNLPMNKGSGNLWSVDMPIKALFNWDNRRIAIFATDDTGRTSSALMALDVIPAYNGGGGGGGNPGWPPGNLDYSALQGFAIFEWKDWDANRFQATPTHVFDWGSEDAVIVMASKYVVNFNNENTIRILNQTTKVVQTQVSTPNNQFQQYDYISGYYIYNCTIDTSKLPMAPAYYLVEATIRDSWIPANQFTFNDRIFISYPAGLASGYPKIMTFKDSGFSVPTDDFTTFNPNNNMIYVEVQNVFGSPWTPSSGDIEIRDFFWNAQIKRTPLYDAAATAATKWNGPVSNLWQVTALPAPPGVYRLVINLGNATEGWPWIGGDNAYVLRFDMFKAGPETYLVSKIIHIEAPKVKLDIVAGGPPAGAARFQEQASLFYYANDNGWEGEMLEVANDKKGYSPTVYLLKAGDINGDTKSDFIAAMYDNTVAKYVLISYVRQPFGSGWMKTVIDSNLGGVPKAIELGNIDLDNDLDVVMIDYNNRIQMYRNDGSWTKTTVDSTTTTKTTLIVGDMDPPGTPNNDPSRSQDIIVGFNTGKITIYRNAFGDGTNWNQDSLSGTSANVDSYADSEFTIYGTITNSYLQTQSPYQDDGTYEQIGEVITYRYATPYPTETGANNTVPDQISELYVGNETTPFTVLYNQTAHIKKWDSTGLLDDLTTFSVKLKVRYYTNNYQGGSDYITWQDGATNVNLIQITGTGGAWVEKEVDITSSFPWASYLQDMSVSFKNTFVDGSSVDFDYWQLNVTWRTGDMASHVYHFTMPTGTTNVLTMWAAKNASADIDNFKVSYSTDNATWTALTLSPTATITSPWPNFVKYTANLPNAISQVWIKVEDTNRVPTSSPVATWVRIGQMYITTAATVTSIGSNIIAMDIADVDGNGANDIVVVTVNSNKGEIWTLLNKPGGIFNLGNMKRVAQDIGTSGPIKNAKWISADFFFNPYQKGYMDIVFATTSGVYNLNQTSLGNWGAVNTMFTTLGGSTFTLKKMWAGDIDGNGRADLLLATSSGGIWYYSNYMGRTSTSGWQLYQIDQLDAASGPSPSLNDMDACLILA